MLLVSAPYALKAGDAETIGGLPASAFVLANGSQGARGAKGAAPPVSASAQKNTAPPANPNVTGKGVVNYVPMWNTTSDIVDSIIFQKASEIGINTTAPVGKLDVNGKTDIRDTLTLFPKGTDSTLAVSGTTFKIDHTGAVTAPLLNATDENLSDVLSIDSAASVPLSVTASASSSTAITGTAASTSGFGRGVQGETASSAGIGVLGLATAPSGSPYAVLGVTTSSSGTGVLGQLVASSQTESALLAIGGAAGVWGDGGGLEADVGVIGTNDDSFAGYFASSSSVGPNSAGFSMWVQNTSSGTPFVAGSGPNLGALKTYCEIDNSGNLNCTGNKNAIVPIDGGKRTVAMSAIESPQNWFEDFGSAQLVNGMALVNSIAISSRPSIPTGIIWSSPCRTATAKDYMSPAKRRPRSRLGNWAAELLASASTTASWRCEGNMKMSVSPTTPATPIHAKWRTGGRTQDLHRGRSRFPGLQCVHPRWLRFPQLLH